MRQQIIKTLAIWGVTLVFLCICSPAKLPVVLYIVPFVLLFMTFYSSWELLSLLHGRFVAKNSEARTDKGLGALLSATAVLLLVLQSLGQLTLRDVATIAAILTLAYLYVRRNLAQKSRKAT